MFALFQEQHKNQMEAMVTASQKAMGAMMEQMKALVGTGHGKLADKENMPPATGNTSNGTAGKKRNKKKCLHRGKHMFHKPAECYKLKANKSKQICCYKREFIRE